MKAHALGKPDLEEKLKLLLSTVALAATTCLMATPAGAEPSKQDRIHHQLVRYYHADGYIKAIGRVAHRTIYSSNPRIRKKWRGAVHWLSGVRKDASQQIYRLRHPPRPAAVMPGIDSCLDTLIRREGNYNPHVWNGGYVGRWDPDSTHGGSGAYGIPQALPGSKMASAGPDWADNPATQIRWMLTYVQKYGGSCGALAHSYAYGWY